MPEAEDLQAVLEELEHVVREKHPDLVRRLRPGLSERELDLLAQTLLPYHVPLELEILYRWHDGWDDEAGGTYRPCFQMRPSSPSRRIRHQRALLGILADDGWHPLCFRRSLGNRERWWRSSSSPAGRRGRSSRTTASSIRTSYDSVTGLFVTALDLLRHGLLPEDTAYPEIVRIAAEHKSCSRAIPKARTDGEISSTATPLAPGMEGRPASRR